MKEKNFEEYIESFFLSNDGGYTKGSDVFDTQYGIYKNTLINFIKENIYFKHLFNNMNIYIYGYS